MLENRVTYETQYILIQYDPLPLVYQLKLKVQHICKYLDIANLFTSEIYSYCSDYYDLMIIPHQLTDSEKNRIKELVEEKETLEFITQDKGSSTYLYFKCMCGKEISISPKIQARGGIVEHPIIYKDGWEIYTITCINQKTQATVLEFIQTLETFEVLQIQDLGQEGIFKSQYISIHQMMRSLTPRQIEIIVKAFESGYYRIPRDVKTSEIAEELEVSRPAIEKSLRNAENKIMDLILPYLMFQNKLLRTEPEKLQFLDY